MYTGYRIDLEDRKWLDRWSIDAVSDLSRQLMAAPEEFDPRKEGWLRTENQGGVGRCFPAGTRITLADGSSRPIEEIVVGDRVVTHKGRVRPVTELFVSSFTGELISLKLQGDYRPLRLTPEHPLLILRDRELDWIVADQLLPGDRVILSAGVVESSLTAVRPAEFLSCPEAIAALPETVSLSSRLGWLLGLFLAKGLCSEDAGDATLGKIALAFPDESEAMSRCSQYLEHVFGTHPELRKSDEPAEDALGVEVEALVTLFAAMCGSGTQGRQLPAFVFRGTTAFRLAVLRGWLEGTGQEVCCESEQPLAATCGSTRSLPLARGLRRLALSLGLVANLSASVTREAPSTYCLSFSASRQRCEYGDTCEITGIARIPASDLTVYNFEVEEDHSYWADDVASHNCAGMASSTVGECCYRDATRGRIIQFNGHYSYLRAQGIDGLLGRDAGSTIRGNVDAAMRFGFCPTGEGYTDPEFPNWQYALPPRYTTQVPRDADRLAAKFRIGSFNMLRNPDEIDVWQKAGVGAIMVGTGWGAWAPDAQGYVRSYNGGGGGGHAWLLYGWLRNGCRLMLNSHSTRWGQQGWAMLTPEFLQQMFRDRRTVVAGMSDLRVPRVRPRSWTESGNRYVRFRRRSRSQRNSSRLD